MGGLTARTYPVPLRLMRTIWLAILILVFGGCGGTEVHREPPEILGERKNQQGEVIQQLVRERTITRKPVLLAPDGPTKSIKYADKYVLQEGDKTRHVVPMNKADEFRNCGRFWPVEGSTRWVGAGIDPVSNQNTGHVAVIEGRRTFSYNENDLHIVVFDAKGVAIHRTFSVQPKRESSKDEFGFENGNRTIRFRSPEGPKKYEVLEDKVSIIGQNTANEK